MRSAALSWPSYYTTDHGLLTTHHSPLTTHYTLLSTCLPATHQADGVIITLTLTLTKADGVIMAVQHVSLPMAAVQFHPESILTRTDLGLQMLRNALSQLRY